MTTRVKLRPASGNDSALAIIRDGEEVGVLKYRLDQPGKGWLTVVEIELMEGQRGWGFGSEAVRLLEAEHPWRSYLANIPRGNGLSLYFWLRLGYHPAHADEAFWRAPDEDDTMAMVRFAQEHGTGNLEQGK